MELWGTHLRSLVSIVTADGSAPLSANISAGTEMTIYIDVTDMWRINVLCIEKKSI